MSSVCLIFLLLCSSGYTLLHQKTSQQCTEMRCPSTATSFGIKSLVNDQSLRSEACVSCKQCSDNGYSICLQARDTRANRQLAGGCSCAHTLPQNCDFDILRSSPVVNITMKNFHVCYADVIQAPPKPLAVNENSSVVVTVEPFWLEPYWKSLDLSNLTLISTFEVKAPDHCDGDVKTSPEGVHICSASVPIEMDDKNAEKKPVVGDDYEHSDNYDEYDDELPPEVQFDRDFFDNAKALESHYVVTVNKPRQLSIRERKIVDRKESAQSETLKFDLKPELYSGKGDQELEDVSPAEENEGDVSEERGGTNFFEDDTVKVKEEQEEEKEPEVVEDAAVEVNLSDIEPIKEEEKEEEMEKKEKADEKASEEKVEEKASEEEASKEQVEKEEKKSDEEEEEKKKTEELKKEQEEEEEEEKEIEEIEKEEKEAVAEEKALSTTSAESDEEKVEKTIVNGTISEEVEELEEEVDEDEKIQWWEHMVRSSDFHRVRLVFLVTLAVFIIFISLVLCIRNRHLCCGKKETKTSNGYRYASAPRSMELVSSEKQSLRQ